MTNLVQVILFEIDCAIFYTNLHELFRQFTSWTNWVNSGKFMDNCWLSCQVMADMKKAYNDLIIINPYLEYLYFLTKRKLCTKSWARFLILWEVRKEGENLKNQTLYAFRHPLMLVEIFTRFLFWLLILWGNTVCAINLSLPSSIFFRYFVYFVKDFSFFSVC